VFYAIAHPGKFRWFSDEEMKTMAQELRHKIDESTVPDWTAKKTANTQAEDFAIIAGIAEVPLDERTWDLLISTFHKEDTQVSDSVIRNFMFNADESVEKVEESQIIKDDVVKKAKDDVVKKVEINAAKKDVSKSQSSLDSNAMEFYTALDKNMSSNKEKNVPVKNRNVASADKNKMVAVNPLNNKQVQKEPLFLPRKDKNSRSVQMMQNRYKQLIRIKQRLKTILIT
jgi:hypothetical protein